MVEEADRTSPTLHGAISFHYEEGRDNHPKLESVAQGLDLIVDRVATLRILLAIPEADQSKWDIARRLLQIAGLVQKTVVQRNLPYATAYKHQQPRTNTPAPPSPPPRPPIPPSPPI